MIYRRRNMLFRREIKIHLKSLITIVIGIIFLLFAALSKQSGMANVNSDILEAFNSLPKIVLAVFGISNFDFTTIGGMFGICSVYIIIICLFYASYLGSKITTIEDKNTDFIFTTPLTKKKIIVKKILANSLVLLLTCLFITLSCFIIFVIYKENNFTYLISIMTSTFFLSLCIFSISLFLGSLIKKAKVAVGISSTLIFIIYLLNVLSTMVDNKVLISLSPMNIIANNDVIKNSTFPYPFLIITLLLSLLFCFISPYLFEKKDL